MDLVDKICLVLYVFASFIILFLNGIVLFAVVKRRRFLLKKRFAILISLAVADFLKVVPAYAQVAAVVHGPRHAYGRSACLVSSSVGFFLITVTALHLALESVNRLVSILWPLRYEQFTNSRKYCAVIVLVWVLPALGVMLPTHLLLAYPDSYHALRMRMFSCSVEVLEEHQSNVWSIYVAYAMLVTAVFFLVPFLIMGLSYSVMFKISLKHIREINRIESQMQKFRHYRESISDEVATVASPSSSRVRIYDVHEDAFKLRSSSSHGNIMHMTSAAGSEGRGPSDATQYWTMPLPRHDDLINNDVSKGASTDSCKNDAPVGCEWGTEARTGDSDSRELALGMSLYGDHACDVDRAATANPMGKASAGVSCGQTSMKLILVKNCDGSDEFYERPQFHEVCCEKPSNCAAEVGIEDPGRGFDQPKIIVTEANDNALEGDPLDFVKEFSVLAAWAEILRQKALEDGDFGFSLSNINQQIKEELRKRKREMRLARTLGLLVGAFLVFYLPMLVFAWTNMARDANPSEFSFDLGRSLVAWALLNSALNPLIYCMRIAEFKTSVVAILRSLQKCYRHS